MTPNFVIEIVSMNPRFLSIAKKEAQNVANKTKHEKREWR